MQKLNDINETLTYLSDGDIVTTTGKDLFVMKNKKISRYFNNNRFVLELNDFVSLYKNTNFYLYEESIDIDESKDEVYYRYYKK